MEEAKEQQERRLAAKELITFLTQYTSLLGLHLESIRADMARTVADVMDQITHISDAGDQKAKMADAVLIKREAQLQDAGNAQPGDCAEFVNASARQLGEVEKKRLKEELVQGKNPLSANVKEAGSILRQHMSSLQHLDGRLRSMLYTIMGALSADDVVGQRVEHIGRALVNLSDSLAKVIENFDDEFNSKVIETFRKDLEQKVYKSYTMEPEKQAFQEIYGYTQKS